MPVGGREHRVSVARSFDFRDPPSCTPLTAREDDKPPCPTECYWFGTQNWVEND